MISEKAKYLNFYVKLLAFNIQTGAIHNLNMQIPRLIFFLNTQRTNLFLTYKQIMSWQVGSCLFSQYTNDFCLCRQALLYFLNMHITLSCSIMHLLRITMCLYNTRLVRLTCMAYLCDLPLSYGVCLAFTELILVFNSLLNLFIELLVTNP